MTSLLVSKADGTLVLKVDLRRRSKLTIGRSPRCDLVLSAPSVSRHHALLYEHAGGWRLADTSSRTGVHAEDGPVRHAELDPETWVRLGPAYLWLVDPPPPPPAPPPLVDLGGPPVALRGELIDRWRANGLDLSSFLDGAASDPAPGTHLAIVDEEYRPVRRIPISRREKLTVGRDVSCDLVLGDTDVSPLHAVLYREGRYWAIADAGASGGLRVDGRLTERRRLRPAMPVTLGGLRCFVDPIGFEPPGDDDGQAAPLDAVSVDGVEPMTAAVSTFLEPQDEDVAAAGGDDGGEGSAPRAARHGWIREPAWPVSPGA